MEEKLVGNYLLGGMIVQIYCMDEWGGDFYNAPDKVSPPKIRVGFGSQEWDRVVTALLHEMMEFEMHKNGLRYDRSNDYSNDHGGYIFMMNHPQFSDICGRVAATLTSVLPVLAVEFRKYKEQKRREARKKKGRKK